MDISPMGLARNCIPNLPLLLKTALLALVGRSPNAEHQDILTELITVAARPILQTPTSLLKSQLNANYDWGVFGHMWIAKYTVSASEQSLRQGSVLGLREAVDFAVRELSTDLTTPTGPVPELVDVQTEWTGYRPDALPFSPRPNLSEREMYERLSDDADPTGPTILYFHGGAHCLMDPCTHRLITSNLARTSHGRVLSVRYRLAPQHPFPCALLDALQTYLALLSPLSNAFHKAVAPAQIVLAGDSSGAGLASSLLLLLLTLSRHDITLSFNNSAVTIPSPPCAGLALTSPYLDVSRSLPSTRANAKWDIIAPPPLDAATPAFPSDAIWPTAPPRAETYCTADMVGHPLVSPVAAPSRLWRGKGTEAVAVYVNVGWEGMLDEALVWCRRVYRSSDSADGDVRRGPIVVFDGYEGMPHCFSVIPWNETGRRAAGNWGRFCWDAVHREVNRREVGTWTNGKTGEVREVRLDELALQTERDGGCGYERESPLTDELVDEMLKKATKWRVELEERMVMEWKTEKR